jgi:hypothetical protein
LPPLGRPETDRPRGSRRRCSFEIRRLGSIGLLRDHHVRRLDHREGLVPGLEGEFVDGLIGIDEVTITPPPLSMRT